MPRSSFIRIVITLAAVAALFGCANFSQPQLTAAEAMQIATSALQNEFPENFDAYQPYTARYSMGVWYVSGTLPSGRFGGTPEADVDDSSGKVVRIAHAQ